LQHNPKMYPLYIFWNINREIVLEILVEGLWESFGKVMEIFTVKSVRILFQTQLVSPNGGGGDSFEKWVGVLDKVKILKMIISDFKRCVNIIQFRIFVF